MADANTGDKVDPGNGVNTGTGYYDARNEPRRRRPHQRNEGTMTTTQRVSVDTQHPAAYKALIALSAEVESTVAAAGLDPLLIELLKIRTSQINGCAFCLRMHTREALKIGEDPDRIAVLPAWEETGYFSATDRAALRLTEAITRVSDGRVSDEDYDTALAALTADQISAVTWLATVMNAFNRVAITSRYHVAG